MVVAPIPFLDDLLRFRAIAPQDGVHADDVAASQSEPTPGGTITVAVASSPISWDLTKSNWDNHYGVTYFLYDPLLVLDAEENPQPWLAEEWTVSDDGLVYEMKLREDVKFHDGSEMDAEAVKAIIDYYRDNAEAAAYHGFETIEAVETVDDSTIRVTLSAPVFAFLFRLGGMPVPSPTALQEMGEDFGTHPVGTGPFTFKEYEPDSHIEYARNETYWGGPPPVETIRVRIIPEQEVQVVELQAQTVDVVYLPPLKDIAGLESSGITIEQVIAPSIEFVSLNVALAPMDELPLRKAIAMAIDRDTIIKEALYGLPEKSRAGAAPVSPYFSEAVPIIEYDPEESGRLLDEAGWVMGDDGIRARDGEPLLLTLLSTEYLDWDLMNQILQEQLRNVGIDTAIETLEYGAYLDRWRDTDTWHLTHHGQGWPRHTDQPIPAAVDPDHFWNVNHIDNSTEPELTAVADQLREMYASFEETLDFDARFKIAEDIQRLVQDTQLSVWLWFTPWFYAIQPRVQGYKLENNVVKFGSASVEG
jgi:peptide/nickel transport system substrate-binding protein